MKKFVSIILCCLIFYAANAGGGWVHAPKKGFFKLGYYSVAGQSFYTLSGKINRIPPYQSQNISLYGEFGIAKRLEAVALFPFYSNVNQGVGEVNGEVFPEADQVTSLGDPQIGLKYGIITNKKVVWSVSGLVKFPIGKTDGGKTGLLQTSDGQYSQLIRTEVSTSFSSFHVTLMAGYRNRVNLKNDLHLGGEIGWNYNQKFYAILKFYSVRPFDQNYVDNGNYLGLQLNDVQYFGYGPELAYSFKNNFGISVAMTTAANSRNITAAAAYQVGVFYSLK